MAPQGGTFQCHTDEEADEGGENDHSKHNEWCWSALLLGLTVDDVLNSVPYRQNGCLH
jgi:hypothetical protein